MSHPINRQIYRAPKSGEILMFVCNQVAKSHEILMFVCLQKGAKQCCDATKFDRAHCAGQRRPDEAVTPQRQSQFTPKMKANAEPRLLSSLV